MKIKNISIYVLLAVVVGIVVGAIDALFGRVLLFITDFRTEHYKNAFAFFTYSRTTYNIYVQQMQ